MASSLGSLCKLAVPGEQIVSTFCGIGLGRVEYETQWKCETRVAASSIPRRDLDVQENSGVVAFLFAGHGYSEFGPFVHYQGSSPRA